LHCIKYVSLSGCLATGSEDGTVRIWDPRSGKSQHILDCTKRTELNQFEANTNNNNSTNWISCLDVDEGGNWLVCGGGFSVLTMWYLAVPSITCHMPTQGTPHSVIFSEGKVISAGNEPQIYHWQLDGKLKLRYQSTSKSIFSLNINHNINNKIMVACGTSPYVDVFKDFTYKGFSFCCSPSE